MLNIYESVYKRQYILYYICDIYVTEMCSNGSWFPSSQSNCDLSINERKLWHCIYMYYIYIYYSM